MQIEKLKCVNLHIEKDPHTTGYETVEEYLLTEWGNHLNWISDGEKQRAIETGHIWTLQWYPNTPVGFYVVAAASLSALEHYVEFEVVDGEPVDREVKH